MALPVAAQERPPVAGDPAAYVRARAADADGAPERAGIGYARALAAAPDDAKIAQRAYRQALAVGDYSLASRAAAILVKAGVAPPDTDLLALAMALRQGDAASAQIAVNRLGRGPLDFLAPALGAWLAHDRGASGVAYLDAQSGNALARRYNARHRALLLIAERRLGEAMTDLALLLGTGDAEPDLRIDAALLFDRVGEGRAAKRLLAQAGTDPRVLAKRRGKVDAAFGTARLFLGLAADLSTDEMGPLVVLLTRAALLLDPGDDRARLYLAEALSVEGATQPALDVLDAVGTRGGFAHGAGVGRVQVLRRAGRDADALALAARLSDERTASSSDAETYGDLLAEESRFADAANAYRTALDRDGAPGEWRLYYLLGTALDRAGRWDEALPALRQATALAPDEAEPLHYLGDAQVRRGENVAGAQALLERAATLKPEDPAIADSLGWSYVQRGDLARGLPLIEKAARGDPAGSRVNEHLGDAYWRLGRRYEARYAWRAAALFAEADDASRIAAKLTDGLAPQSN
ncbi:hypothetical protein TS85_06105 [Sphingomonas hengshuiensis]|uniref:Tetratricopeptide repeat protein n=1 Tax=Sphingomonas hengshuiensis TaxID=1609977 RepID=A0A7U5BFG9_9SPHN|nr:hypothetical protein TS85_06105 [Sphingomonas hengshuiensis]